MYKALGLILNAAKTNKQTNKQYHPTPLPYHLMSLLGW
jgi:hypothetical protein